jgi:hypothetical protein
MFNNWPTWPLRPLATPTSAAADLVKLRAREGSLLAIYGRRAGATLAIKGLIP